nr:hypothetical protein [uncultured Blautia sp.]
MEERRNVKIITEDEKLLVLIETIQFKGKRKINWKNVKQYLKQYVGKAYKIKADSEIIHIGGEFPEEFTESESRKALMGANTKAKANMALAIPELIEIATNPVFQNNHKNRHNKSAKNGWFRYDVRVGLPIFEGGKLVRYNIYSARLVINYAANGKKYLYDVISIKKETSRPQQSVW